MPAEIKHIQHYIDIKDPEAFRVLSDRLYPLLKARLAKDCLSLVFICIGTDRSTGDSLGPITGYKIGSINYENVYVFGTLEKPVHAKNLSEMVCRIEHECIKPCVVAIDACLGRMDRVGFLSVGEGPLKPGAGVSKDLKPVGDVFLTGIVNFGGFMDFLILQNTRLHVVMKMADTIALSIRHVLWRLYGDELLARPQVFPYRRMK